MSNDVCILVRVSTESQGKSGLSIAHQLESCRNFCETNNLNIIDEFIEIGSGGKTLDERPVLQKALTTCESKGARLVVNKLSRLSRRVSFIAGLLDKNTRFFITDMGFRDVSTFELHLMASFAQLERERISQRTIEGMRKSKKKAGNPNIAAARVRGAEVVQIKKRQFIESIIPTIEEIRSTGVSTALGIAECLNRRGLKGRRGGRFHAATVISILKSHSTFEHQSTL